MEPKVNSDVPSASEPSTSRRTVLKAAAWAAPAIVTLAVTPSFAGTSSGQPSVTRPQQPL